MSTNVNDSKNQNPRELSGILRASLSQTAYPAGVYPGQWAFPDGFDGSINFKWPSTMTGHRNGYPYLPKITSSSEIQMVQDMEMNAESPKFELSHPSNGSTLGDFQLSDNLRRQSISLEEFMAGHSSKNGKDMVFDSNLMSNFVNISHGTLNLSPSEIMELDSPNTTSYNQSIETPIAGSDVSFGAAWNSVHENPERWLDSNNEWGSLPPFPNSRLPQGYDYFQTNSSQNEQKFISPDMIFQPTQFSMDNSEQISSFIDDNNTGSSGSTPSISKSIVAEKNFSPNPVANWIGTLNSKTTNIEQDLMLNIVFCYPKVCQRSYEGERRFLCPPPQVFVYGSNVNNSIRNFAGNLQPISVSKTTNVPILGEEFVSTPIVKLLDVSLLNSSIEPENQVAIFTFDKFFSRDKESKHCAFKFKFKEPSNNVEYRVESKKIAMVSKPSKKPTTKDSSPHFSSGSLISIHNRINSQSSTTRFLSFTEQLEDGQAQACMIH